MKLPALLEWKDVYSPGRRAARFGFIPLDELDRRRAETIANADEDRARYGARYGARYDPNGPGSDG